MDKFLRSEHRHDALTPGIEPCGSETSQQADVIDRAAALLNMTRTRFVSLFDGAGDESLEQRARRIIGRSIIEGLLDRGIADLRREPVMNERGH